MVMMMMVRKGVSRNVTVAWRLLARRPKYGMTGFVVQPPLQQHGCQRFPQKRFRSALVEEEDRAFSYTPFVLADIGEGIAEVELLRWFVKEGQSIHEFDPVCEVQSDKATVEITSRYEGRIEKLAFENPGSMIKVGEPILWIQQHEDDDDSQEPTIEHISINQEPTIEDRSLLLSDIPSDRTEDFQRTAVPKPLTSPAVRKIAREKSLDLTTLVGTGPSGRITKGDVLKASATTKEPTTITTTAQLNLPLVEDTVVELRGYNRIMADTMTASLQIPHMVFSDEINLNHYIRYKQQQQQQDDGKLKFLPLAIKAASKALEEYPWLNASYDKEEITLWKDHNIGIAMDTPKGLLVPVVKECQDKTVLDITQEIENLKEAALTTGLPSRDLQGATFSLSNVGSIGGTYTAPIIAPPQVAIGAFGQIRRLPRFVGSDVQEAHICTVSWAADHRVVDGATLARFHALWKSYMEDPLRLLLECK